MCGSSLPRQDAWEGEPLPVYASTDTLMPAYLPGTAPIATPDQIILVLGDFRGRPPADGADIARAQHNFPRRAAFGLSRDRSRLNISMADTK